MVQCEKYTIRCIGLMFAFIYVMLLLTEATLFFLNIDWPSSTKNSLAGRVKNWMGLVDKSTHNINLKNKFT